jgi:asparagine synthase (glutamine-hydrolysing)
MCGINGIFAHHDSAPPVDRGEVVRVRDAMRIRGPDGEGVWMSDDGRVGFGHRRLAIIDLNPTGAQPMTTPAGNWITFNGEIYNYKALRDELQGRGYQFQSQSDTEVMLHLYADRGIDMVDSLRGMYAFALWDAARRTLHLVRDPFGIKPLYYADDGKTIRFASQVKALLQGAPIDLAPDPAAHVGFFTWGSVPEPRTLYRSIRAVPSGTALSFDASGRRTERNFFNITAEFVAAEARGGDVAGAIPAEELIREALNRSVRRHMVADVPVGVFLSSGLDSSAIAAFASVMTDEPLRTITLGCSEYKGTNTDETPVARVIAQLYGCNHTERWCAKGHFVGEIEDIMRAMDQPSIDGANTFLVSREAARAGLKVALSGLGGDETLGGYPSFREIPKASRTLAPFARVPGLGAGIRLLASTVPERYMSPKYAGVVEYGGDFGDVYFLRRALFMPWELPRVMDRDLARAGWQELDVHGCLAKVTAGIRSDFFKVSALEMTQYMRNQLLRDTDWAGMSSSLEVRVPFLDVDFLRMVATHFAQQPLSRTKILAGIHTEEVARRIASRAKTGFLIPLRKWGEDLIGNTRFQNRGLRGWARAVHARFA